MLLNKQELLVHCQTLMTKTTSSQIQKVLVHACSNQVTTKRKECNKIAFFENRGFGLTININLNVTLCNVRLFNNVHFHSCRHLTSAIYFIPIAQQTMVVLSIKLTSLAMHYQRNTKDTGMDGSWLCGLLYIVTEACPTLMPSLLHF